MRRVRGRWRPACRSARHHRHSSSDRPPSCPARSPGRRSSPHAHRTARPTWTISTCSCMTPPKPGPLIARVMSIGDLGNDRCETVKSDECQHKRASYSPTEQQALARSRAPHRPDPLRRLSVTRERSDAQLPDARVEAAMRDDDEAAQTARPGIGFSPPGRCDAVVVDLPALARPMRRRASRGRTIAWCRPPPLGTVRQRR